MTEEIVDWSLQRQFPCFFAPMRRGIKNQKKNPFFFFFFEKKDDPLSPERHGPERRDLGKNPLGREDLE